MSTLTFVGSCILSSLSVAVDIKGVVAPVVMTLIRSDGCKSVGVVLTGDIVVGMVPVVVTIS